jgi:hypothetical protein
MAEDALVRTGIAGFDELLLGGIPRTNVVLVEGGVGSGKSCGQNYEPGEHTLQINDGGDLNMFRRVQAPFRHNFPRELDCGQHPPAEHG